MTIKELINKLNKCNPEAEIHILIEPKKSTGEDFLTISHYDIFNFIEAEDFIECEKEYFIPVVLNYKF